MTKTEAKNRETLPLLNPLDASAKPRETATQALGFNYIVHDIMLNYLKVREKSLAI